jgi:hypothetical protein
MRIDRSDRRFDLPRPGGVGRQQATSRRPAAPRPTAPRGLRSAEALRPSLGAPAGWPKRRGPGNGALYSRRRPRSMLHGGPARPGRRRCKGGRPGCRTPDTCVACTCTRGRPPGSPTDPLRPPTHGVRVHPRAAGAGSVAARRQAQIGSYLEPSTFSHIVLRHGCETPRRLRDHIAERARMAHPHAVMEAFRLAEGGAPLCGATALG